jgi:hypothetical protein
MIATPSESCEITGGMHERLLALKSVSGYVIIYIFEDASFDAVSPSSRSEMFIFIN